MVSGRGRSWFRGGHFFFTDFPAQFAVGSEQSPVSYGKAFLFFLRHEFFSFGLLEYFLQRAGSPRSSAAARLDLLAGRRGFAADIAQRHPAFAAGHGQGSGAGDFADIFAFYLNLAARRRATAR